VLRTYWIRYTTLLGVARTAQVDAYSYQQAVNTFLARSVEPVEIVAVTEEHDEGELVT
jgi:hypothetical protein